MPKVTEEDVYRIAKLARLHINDESAPALADDLSSILDYVKTLDDIPVYEPTERSEMSTLRPDTVATSVHRDQLLAAAPMQNGDGFVVPRVVG